MVGRHKVEDLFAQPEVGGALRHAFNDVSTGLVHAASVISAAIDDSWLVDHVSEPKAPMFDETFVSIAPIHLRRP